MNERILTTRELNRALLARQLLLERADLPLVTALEAVAGLQTQYAPSGYIGLWSRLRDFRRESLTAALSERRAIQATLMRATIHTVSTRDFVLFSAGTRNSRREWWLRVQRGQLGGVDMDAVAARVRALLADGPRRAAEMLDLLAAEGLPRSAWAAAGFWVDLVRVPPSGTWERRRADLYALADSWLPSPGARDGSAGTGAADVGEEDGVRHLAVRYLGGFGPASLNDMAGWAGLPPAVLRPVVESLGPERYRDEHGRELIDLPGAAVPDPDTPAPVRFLPTWDATLLVHARRTQIVPERYRPLVFNTKTPHSVPTFLVDGAVAGTWRYEKGRVIVSPFEELTGGTRRELDEEADRLTAFHADG